MQIGEKFINSRKLVVVVAAVDDNYKQLFLVQYKAAIRNKTQMGY